VRTVRSCEGRGQGEGMEQGKGGAGGGFQASSETRGSRTEGNGAPQIWGGVQRMGRSLQAGKL